MKKYVYGVQKRMTYLCMKMYKLLDTLGNSFVALRFRTCPHLESWHHSPEKEEQKEMSIKIFSKQPTCRLFRILILVGIHCLVLVFQGVRTKLQLSSREACPSYPMDNQCPRMRHDLTSKTEGTVWLDLNQYCSLNIIRGGQLTTLPWDHTSTKIGGLRSPVCRLATKSCYVVPRSPTQGWISMAQRSWSTDLLANANRSRHKSHISIRLFLAQRSQYRSLVSTVRHQRREENGGFGDTIHIASVWGATSVFDNYCGFLLGLSRVDLGGLDLDSFISRILIQGL